MSCFQSPFGTTTLHFLPPYLPFLAVLFGDKNTMVRFPWLTHLASPFWISLARWINLYSRLWVVTLGDKQKIEICKPLAVIMVHEIFKICLKKKDSNGQSFLLKKKKTSVYTHTVYFKECFKNFNRNECISPLWETNSRSAEPSGTSTRSPFLSRALAVWELLSLSPCFLVPHPRTSFLWLPTLVTEDGAHGFDFITLKSKHIASNQPDPFSHSSHAQQRGCDGSTQVRCPHLFRSMSADVCTLVQTWLPPSATLETKKWRSEEGEHLEPGRSSEGSLPQLPTYSVGN